MVQFFNSYKYCNTKIKVPNNNVFIKFGFDIDGWWPIYTTDNRYPLCSIMYMNMSLYNSDKEIWIVKLGNGKRKG